MHVKTVGELLTLESGEIVRACRGTLKCLWDRRTGTVKSGPNAGKEWALQNGILADGDQELPVKFDGRDEVPASWRGKSIYFVAAESKRGFSGLKIAEDKDKDGNPRPCLKVTGSAEVVLASSGTDTGAPDTPDDDDGGLGPTKPQPDLPKQPTQQPPVAPPDLRKQPEPEHPAASPEKNNVLLAARRDANRVANMYLVAVSAALYVRAQAQEQLGYDMPEAHIQACTSTLYIDLARRGLVDSMPTGVLKLKH